MNFTTRDIAIHLVDPKKKQPDLADALISIEHDFDNKEDQQAVREFINRHLEAIWQDDGADNADVADDSIVMRIWREFRDKKVTFLDASKKLAARLHEVSPQHATRGLLLAVHFSVAGKPGKEHLALIKLDPGERDLVRLEQERGKILLDLAVEHIKLALPDPRGVLKWAILPHPDLARVGAKLKDRQTKVEAAVYFMDFLGARARRRDHIAINAVVGGVADYLGSEHPHQRVKEKLPAVAKELTDRLAAGDTLTQTKIVSVVKETSGVDEVDDAKLKAALKKRKVGKVRLTTPENVSKQKVTYTLDNGIRISGPSAVVETQVEVVEVDDGLVFTTRAASYTISRGR